MSNYWNGVGVPENGQTLRVANGDFYTFIGVATNAGIWACESEGGTIGLIDAEHCMPIKSPEEVDREKSIDSMMLIVDGLDDNYDCCKALHEEGYRKVKPLSFDEYKSMYNSGGAMADDYKFLVDNGHIIEKK